MSVNANKTIAYIRVSSQRQVDEGNSLEAQKRRIIQLAQFKGLSIAPEDFLIEKGVSAGIPLWERPVGRVLRRKLLSGEYSNLIAMKLDRLFRITTDMLLTVQEVEDMGVRLLIAVWAVRPSIHQLAQADSCSPSLVELLKWSEVSFQKEHKKG